MTFSHSLRALLADAKTLAREGVAVYAFGSAARAEAAEPSDLDLLIVYQNERREGALAMRQHLIDALARTDTLPLDFVILTVEEEAELDFIASEQAKRIC